MNYSVNSSKNISTCLVRFLAIAFFVMLYIPLIKDQFIKGFVTLYYKFIQINNTTKNFITLANTKSTTLHFDQQYIEALRSHDTGLIENIYNRMAPGIKTYLQSKGASTEEAGDLFQEAIIDVYNLATDKQFVLTCPLEAFLLLICKRKWINLVEKNKRRGVTNSIDDGYTQLAGSASPDAEEFANKIERENLVVAMLQKISERCREIIIAAYSGKHQELLAKEMGVSYAYLRKKKSQCMAELIQLVRTRKS